EIASAYSIKALDSRISSLEGGSATAISVSGSGNAVTSVTKNGTTISVVKGSTFLTSHQSLDGYVNAISVSGSGNAITSVSKSGKGITFTKGATFLTSHQSLANYYTKSSVDSLLSGKSATSHTHSVIINGTTKIIAASGGTAVNLGTYLTSHQSLADYAKKTDIPTSLKSPNSLSWSGYNTGSYDGSSPKSFVIPSNTNQLTNGAGFITSSASISGNAATATKVNHSLLVFGKSFNGSADVTVADTDLIASISTGTSNVTDKTEILTSYASDNGFNDSNAKNKIHRRPASAIWGYINSKTISNADKLDNVHLNGIFTALSNTNNGVSMTIGTVAKSLANMQVYSATKLVTARNISIAGRDFVGNVNFDGTGNVSLNGAINYCTINIGNTDPNPFKRIAHIKVAHSWNDNALLLYISQGYHGGNFGLCRVEFRTNDIANSDTAGGGVSLRWLIRQGYATDSIQAGYYIHLKNAYVDVFLKTTGAYQGTVIRVIQDSRGSINNSFGLINSTYNTEAYTSLSAAATALYNVAYQGTVSGTDTCTVSHANSATKLQTPRTIWGQSFDGTGNVNGTIYINNSNSSNGAIRLNSDISSNARISAIDDQVIFNTGNAIRFGETAWDWNKWAGLKYTHSNKTIYLGIADNSVFNANSAQSNGTLKFPGITTITPDRGARIGGSGGNLYLGNANNSGWVYVQDMCSQVNSSYWNITQYGSATFKSLTVTDVISCNSISVSNNAIIAGNLSVNGLITAKAINATTADVNAFGTKVNNWDGSIAANVTNMFNGILQDNIQVEYSMDNGASWNTYPGNPENRFNLVNDNARVFNYFLGSNNMLGDTNADKLAQIKKNQLRVTVKIPDETYQELSWISVDVNNGVDIKCQVYFGSSTGGYKEYVSKIISGWSHKCDICVGPLGVNVGNDTYRYVRLVFSHPSNNTNLRNGIVAKIRALALTKYNYPSDRYTISTTGHIYDYDPYMNTYFPNSILAKGGVTAYQSSDIRLKQDLRKLDYLGIIKAMGGTFGFAWKKDNTRSIGWIAQHVLCNPHLKDIVETDEKGYYKINYWSPKLIATAFGAIEQVGDEVSRLKARVVFLESEVQRLSGDKEDCNKKRLDNKNINSLN
ncbi:tail fiber domain-containing protein, partial [Segatella copri]